MARRASARTFGGYLNDMRRFLPIAVGAIVVVGLVVWRHETRKVKFVTCRGERVIAGWPEKIREAQKITIYTIAGKTYARIRYGDEAEDWGALSGRPCHDCGAVKGEFHVVGCDVERCPVCKGQAMSCDCDIEEMKDERAEPSGAANRSQPIQSATNRASAAASSGR